MRRASCYISIAYITGRYKTSSVSRRVCLLINIILPILLFGVVVGFLFMTNVKGPETPCHNYKFLVCLEVICQYQRACQNSPIICVVLALDSWNYCSGKQAQQPNICKIAQSSLTGELCT